MTAENSNGAAAASARLGIGSAIGSKPLTLLRMESGSAWIGSSLVQMGMRDVQRLQMTPPLGSPTCRVGRSDSRNEWGRYSSHHRIDLLDDDEPARRPRASALDAHEVETRRGGPARMVAAVPVQAIR